ncbi:MAG: arylesterase [Opitutales bacterium]|nr:arylesterase [Opitutales bacterium]
MTTFNHIIPMMTNFTFNAYLTFVMILLGTSGCQDPSNSSIDSNPSTSRTVEKAFKILILGDSLTEGYGVMENEAYPTLVQHRLNLEVSPKTGMVYHVINGGITGSTSSGGVSRINWFLQAKPDFLVLALGGNDGLRGIPVKETKQNLLTIIQTAQSHDIPAILTGMKMPPNYGLKYTNEFANIFPSLAQSLQIPLIPFLLEGVGGNPEFNLPDRIHPNPAGHKIIGDLVFTYLSQELSSLSPLHHD